MTPPQPAPRSPAAQEASGAEMSFRDLVDDSDEEEQGGRGVEKALRHGQVLVDPEDLQVSRSHIMRLNTVCCALICCDMTKSIAGSQELNNSYLTMRAASGNHTHDALPDTCCCLLATVNSTLFATSMLNAMRVCTSTFALYVPSASILLPLSCHSDAAP